MRVGGLGVGIDTDRSTGDGARPTTGTAISEATVHTRTTSGFPTAPIVGLELAAAREHAPEARSDQARAHEAAAEVLADRGDWRRAYQHLRAAMALVRVERTQPVHVPEQLRNEVDRLRRERAEAREQSRRDSLTATYNRRYLDERLTTLRGDGHTSVCVALADVDHFKQVNDTYGHALGDQVLRRLVALMSEGLPTDGFCARYGGEEFALVLPGTQPAEAVRLCEEARARVDGHPWHEVADGLRVTTSLGVACVDTSSGRPDAGSTPGSPLDGADALLYVAKRAGRNAVAYRDAADGRVRLAGPAGARRGIEAAARSVFPRA